MVETTVRDRQKPLKVYVSEEERQKIEALAKDCQLAPSTYLRNVGMGYRPRSAFDREVINKLVKLHADQGRLGGLLKQWLGQKKGESVPAIDVRDVLHKIEVLQVAIAKLVMEEARRL